MRWFCDKDCENRTLDGRCGLPFCTEKKDGRYMIIPYSVIEAMYKEVEKEKERRKRKFCRVSGCPPDGIILPAFLREMLNNL